MRSAWQGILHILFWSYDRGSWPYDVMVIGIVVFVLLTPRRLFHDQPQRAGLPTTDVQLIAEDAGNSQRTYRVDAAMLPLPKRSTHPTPELERETHDILGRTVDDLKGHSFQVWRIDPVPNPNGSIAYYDVFVKW
jgi:hypothetical protein